MQLRKTSDVARSHQPDLGHHLTAFGRPTKDIRKVFYGCPARTQSITSCRGARKSIEMSSQYTDTVTAQSSVPEILQAKGRRLRVNYVRRDGNYEVCCWKWIPDTQTHLLTHAVEHHPLLSIDECIGPEFCMQGWGLHVWADVRAETAWESPLPLQGCIPHALPSIGMIGCCSCDRSTLLHIMHKRVRIQ